MKKVVGMFVVLVISLFMFASGAQAQESGIEQARKQFEEFKLLADNLHLEHKFFMASAGVLAKVIEEKRNPLAIAKALTRTSIDLISFDKSRNTVVQVTHSFSDLLLANSKLDNSQKENREFAEITSQLLQLVSELEALEADIAPTKEVMRQAAKIIEESLRDKEVKKTVATSA